MGKLIGYFVIAACCFLGFAKYLMGTTNAPMLASATAQKPAMVQQQALIAGSPAAPQAIALAADSAGHFKTAVRINNGFIDGLVDTGASLVAIPFEDARKIGLNPAPSTFTRPMQTANGLAYAAPITLKEVRIGAVTVRDVEGVVMPAGALHITLVGMSFMKRLASSEMRGGTLVLRQ